jgi:hypothetical protein
VQRALLGNPWLVLSTSVVTVGALAMIVWLIVRTESMSGEHALTRRRVSDVEESIATARATDAERVLADDERLARVQELGARLLARVEALESRAADDTRSHFDVSELFARESS